jgi:hypothetical protein
MHNLIFTKEALLDIEEIAIWYEKQREGLSSWCLGKLETKDVRFFH